MTSIEPRSYPNPYSLDELTVVGLISDIADFGEPVSVADRLLDDLYLDSIQMVELVASIETLVGDSLSEREIAALVSVDDVVGVVRGRLRAAARRPDYLGRRAVGPERLGTGSARVPRSRHVRLVAAPDDADRMDLDWLELVERGRWSGGRVASWYFESVDSGEVIGVCSCDAIDLANDHGWFSCRIRPDMALLGWPLEGLVLLGEHVFGQVGLRKVYLQAVEPEAGAFRSTLGRLVRVEGRLARHEQYGGRWVDLLVMSVEREVFAASSLRHTVLSGRVEAADHRLID